MIHIPATPADFIRAASLIPCPANVFKAVCLVESRGHGFDADGNIVCLVEPHIIWKRASMRERSILKPYGLAYPKWGMRPYGTYAAQILKFKKIIALTNNMTLAILGTSFGLLQILGENYRDCAFTDATDFYVSMISGEAAQLEDAAILMRAWGLSKAMCALDWQAVARRWNGPGQVTSYANKLQAAYESVKGGMGGFVAATAPSQVEMGASIKSPPMVQPGALGRVKMGLNIG